MKLTRIYGCDKLLTDCDDWVKRVKDGKLVQVRKLMIRTYESRDVIDKYLAETAPSEYAMIYHDKDVNTDGDPVSPHWHVVCHWRKPRTASNLKNVAKIFTDTEQTLIQSPINLAGATRYLWHEKCPDKYQYNKDDVIAVGLDRLLETQLEGAEKDNAMFIEDLQTLSRYELGVKYGKDYMKNFRRYADFVGDVQFQACQSAVARLAQAWGVVKFRDGDAQCWTQRETALRVIGNALDKINRLVGSDDLASSYAVEKFALVIYEAIETLDYIPAEYKENKDE